MRPSWKGSHASLRGAILPGRGRGQWNASHGLVRPGGEPGSSWAMIFPTGFSFPSRCHRCPFFPLEWWKIMKHLVCCGFIPRCHTRSLGLDRWLNHDHLTSSDLKWWY
jgi:hypothetical protein